MNERIEIFELIERLDAASRDERLSDGMLYRAAAERLAEYISRDVKYWHSIMQRTDKQADRIAELEATLDKVRGCQQYVLKGSGTPAEVMSGGTYMKTADVQSALGDEE